MNAKIVFLAAISAKMPKPLNVSVGGSSSAGKNHLIGKVAQFIPDEGKKFLTGMSPKVLMHSAEDEFEHKSVFIAEYEGVAGADYPIRTMQSEQEIEWEYVDRDSKNGLHKKKKKVKSPAAFIQATTRPMLHPENETRLLFLEMDESEEQTRAINLRQALQAERKIQPCSPQLYDPWHTLIRGLEPRAVWIPFATQLAESLPPRVRSRRDLPKVLGLIEASAYLHQHQRNRGEQGTIVATPEDYRIAKELFEHCYHTGPDARVGELIKAGEQFGREEFSVADLMRKTHWGKSKTYAVLNRAEELGNIGEGERRGQYSLLHGGVEPSLILPAKVRLSAQNFRISTGIYLDDFRISGFPPQAVGRECVAGKME